MQSRRVALGTGLTYHLLEWGGDDAARDHTVLLLHGFLDLGWGWRATVDAGLADRFHVVAPDLRGHGDSDWIGPGGYYHFADYLADVHDLVQKVARARLSIVGHSMGGSIAAYYAGMFPERVHRLALLEGLGPPESLDTGPERWVAWLAAWAGVRARPQRSYATVDEAAERLCKHDALLDAALARELAEHGTGDDGAGRRRFKHDPLHLTIGPYGFQRQVAERFWRRITCPTLLVDGAQSTFRYDDADAAVRHGGIANARRVELPGAAHMMQRHQPAALAALLRDFLSN